MALIFGTFAAFAARAAVAAVTARTTIASAPSAVAAVTATKELDFIACKKIGLKFRGLDPCAATAVRRQPFTVTDLAQRTRKTARPASRVLLQAEGNKLCVDRFTVYLAFNFE